MHEYFILINIIGNILLEKLNTKKTSILYY